MTVSTRLLHDGWSFTAEGASVPATVRAAALAPGAIPATVPGSATTDLLAAGLIDDPYLDDNERLQGWIGVTDFCYRTVFSVDAGALGREHPEHPERQQQHELVFEGLDTVAEVSLNGVELASVRNMHRTYRLDVGAQLREGPNELVVAFRSPVKAADEASLALGYRPHTNHHPYNAIRKMACGFGWDWGIDTSTSGIWRPVRLESWSGARLGAVRVAGTVVEGVPTAVAVVEVRGSGAAGGSGALGAGLEVEFEVAGRAVTAAVETEAGAGEVRLELAIPDARLWWPRGHGEAVLHDSAVVLREAGPATGEPRACESPRASVPLDRVERRIGFRSAEFVAEPAETGGAVELRVNGRPIEVRGANWIPDDAFPHRVDRARLADRLGHAEYAGINLLRVWGGGVYESDDFYGLCDERGILTWQDFLLACAAYAEEEPLRSEFEAEARDALIRLGSHPSLVVMNGNNENIWGRQDWGWEAPLDGRTWGAGYYYELFPALVAELAPHIPYTPGSPFSPDRDAHQNAESTGTMHIWDLWNERDYPHYRDYRPRFVSEFGWQGPPTWSTLVESVHDDPLTPESPGMQVHQKALKGNDKLTAGLVAHLPLPDDMADWHWAMSLNQAVAVRTAIEWFRSLAPHCTGSIVWQLNDCWPVTSWAALDGAGRRKPLLHALRQAHAERMLTVQPRDVGGLEVVALNDTGEAWAGELVAERVGFDGAVLARETVRAEADARGASRWTLPVAVATVGDATGELLVVRLGDAVAHHFFAEARESALVDPALQIDAVPAAGGEGGAGGAWTVTVTAGALARDVTLLVDRVAADAHVDGGLVTLLPGESAVFAVRGAVGVEAGAFAHPGVVRTANDLVAGRR
ncbi:glycoside hydrolase family 2 protein [Herbiconiux moechotypicola]|uniref:beta-mannosidase n=1 Tax=Herbiconiux moechotypicola TaxID=637393 RepID=A0ABN3DA32_9MICO|nr:glycoside hydrolase family 2 protein [Herbiconiux moechotypicola]MCS5728998.1 glycoside hydrolase family 2 protein [Herbiconiux moechotypicola]